MRLLSSYVYIHQFGFWLSCYPVLKLLMLWSWTWLLWADGIKGTNGHKEDGKANKEDGREHFEKEPDHSCGKGIPKKKKVFFSRGFLFASCLMAQFPLRRQPQQDHDRQDDRFPPLDKFCGWLPLVQNWRSRDVLERVVFSTDETCHWILAWGKGQEYATTNRYWHFKEWRWTISAKSGIESNLASCTTWSWRNCACWCVE